MPKKSSVLLKYGLELSFLTQFDPQGQNLTSEVKFWRHRCVPPLWQMRSFQVEQYVRQTTLASSDQPTRWECLKGDFRFKTHLFLPKLSQVIWRPKLINSVLSALNSFKKAGDKPWQQHDLLLWSSDLCIKPANSKGEFPLHQVCTKCSIWGFGEKKMRMNSTEDSRQSGSPVLSTPL